MPDASAALAADIGKSSIDVAVIVAAQRAIPGLIDLTPDSCIISAINRAHSAVIIELARLELHVIQLLLTVVNTAEGHWMVFNFTRMLEAKPTRLWL